MGWFFFFLDNVLFIDLPNLKRQFRIVYETWDPEPDSLSSHPSSASYEDMTFGLGFLICTLGIIALMKSV